MLLVDDSELARHGLETMLRPFADQVVLAHVDLSRSRTTPDADLALVDATGHQLAAAVSRLREGGIARVALFSWRSEADSASVVGRSEVDGYVSKRLPATSMLEALRTAASAERAPQQAFPGQAHGLAEREAQVLLLMARGLRNQDTAERMRLSLNTVKSYLRAAYGKIGVRSRSQAVLWAVDHGFRDPTAEAYLAERFRPQCRTEL